MSEIVSHKCPNCGSALNYSAQDGAIKCISCGSVYSAEEMRKYQEQLESVSDEEQAKRLMEQNKDREDRFSWNDQQREEISADGMRTCRCESCGGSIISPPEVAATNCPYCGNPALIVESLGGYLKPDLVIPFKIEKAQARAGLERFLKNKFLVPVEFRTSKKIDSIAGIYVPFWLFDSAINADAEFHATRVRTYRSGDYRITETSHYMVYRNADMAFEKVPVDASIKMDDDYMDSIEPYRYDEMKSFDGLYLAGYHADKYTVSSEQAILRANDRIRNSAIAQLRNTVIGYNTVTPVRSTVVAEGKGDISYAMMPVWTLGTTYKGKIYNFAMNGQTGRFVGKVPVSFMRCLVLWLCITLGLMALFVAIVYFFGIVF